MYFLCAKVPSPLSRNSDQKVENSKTSTDDRSQASLLPIVTNSNSVTRSNSVGNNEVYASSFKPTVTARSGTIRPSHGVALAADATEYLVPTEDSAPLFVQHDINVDVEKVLLHTKNVVKSVIELSTGVQHAQPEEFLDLVKVIFVYQLKNVSLF